MRLFRSVEFLFRFCGRKTIYLFIWHRRNMIMRRSKFRFYYRFAWRYRFSMVNRTQFYYTVRRLNVIFLIE